MRILFQVCFGVGLGYSVISFVLGQILGNFTGGHADAGGTADIDLDMNADAGVDFDVSADIDAGHGASSVSPFKPTVIAAFLAVFGGVGMITLPMIGFYAALTVSAAAGLIAGYVIYRYVYTFLYNAQNTSTVDKQRYHYFCSCFHDSAFERVGGGISFHSGFGIGDGHFYKSRQFAR